MKKFLVAILILIPAVVVLALSATGQIIKVAIKVEARDIIIKDNKNKELDLEDTYFLDLIKQNYLEIMVQVIPSISYNLNVIFRPTEDSEGEVRIEKQERPYVFRIYPSKEGKCDLLVVAENNEEVKKTVHFYIITDVMSDKGSALIALTEGNKEEGGEVLDLSRTYYLTEPAKLFLDCYPAESIGNNEIIWQSDNENIVKADQNGFIYPEGIGDAKIFAMVEDKAGKSHIFTLRVNTGQAVVKRTSLYLSEENFTEDFIYEKILLQDDLRVQKEDWGFAVYNGDDEQVQSINVTIVDKEEKGIVNGDYLDTVYIGIGGYRIEAGILDYGSREKLTGLNFTSDKPDIAMVEKSGKLIPLKQGDVTISVYQNGELIAFKNINVSARAITFRLNRDNQSNLAGIKQEYVWAFNWLQKDEEGKTVLDKSYSVDLLFSRLTAYMTHTYPGIKYVTDSAVYLSHEGEKASLNNISLIWSVDNPEYASVNQNGDLEFYEAVCGNEVTVTATELIHGVKTRLQRSYTFKFIEDKTAVNVESEEEFRGVNEGYSLATVLHNNLFIDKTKQIYSPYYLVWSDRVFVRNSIYGNGKAIKGKRTSGDTVLLDIRLQGQYYDYSLPNAEDQFSPLIIENLELNGWDEETIPYDEISDDTLFQELIRTNYYCWERGEYYNYLDGTYNQESEYMMKKRLANARLQINYCYFHNAVKAMTLYEMINLEITGCIFSNLAFAAIGIEQTHSGLSTLTLNRVVIRDNTPVGVSSVLRNDTDIYPDAKTPCKIIVKGFLDAYTWMPVDGYGSLSRIIPRSVLDSLQSIINIDTLYSFLDEAVRDLMKTVLQRYGLTLTYKGQEYANLAILSLGLWEDVNPERIIDETGQYKKIPFRFDNNLSIKIKGLPISLEMVSKVLPSTVITKQSILLSYDINKGGALLPDADCPSNVALYRRLQGK
jgi:hypothetical protein